MQTAPVLVDEHDGVLIITINRPEARNALNLAVAGAISRAADELDTRSDLYAGIVTGAGGVFSAGMDLKAFLAGESPDIKGRGLCGITQAPPRKPLIAAVEGWALAGGFELVLACDLVVAGQSARFGLPEVKRSLVAAAGGALFLARRIAPMVAMEMLLTGDPIDAERAYQIGLINKAVRTGDALNAALAMARSIAANGPLAVAATKQLARHTYDWTADEAWAGQAGITEPVFVSHDAREGATAFAEKRKPVWQGQ